MGRNECFFGYNIAGRRGKGRGWRDEGVNPKPLKKIVIRSRVPRNNYLKGFSFSHTQYQVRLASNVGDKADGCPSKIFPYHQERVTGGVIPSSRTVTKKLSRQVSSQIP